MSYDLITIAVTIIINALLIPLVLLIANDGSGGSTDSSSEQGSFCGTTGLVADDATGSGSEQATGYGTALGCRTCGC